MSTDAPAPTPTQVTATEIRVLEGPNLYFPRPAVKVQLDLTPLALAPPDAVQRLARAVGLGGIQPGAPGSLARQRAHLRIVEKAVRALARASGATRLGVRVRPTHDATGAVAAFVWRNRGRAEALAEALAPVLTDWLAGVDPTTAVASRLPGLTSASGGEPARVLTPTVPVIAITGTNGKTTTTRLVAHIAMAAGLRTAWSSTDGIVVQGDLVEPGDYSGPAGARGVLEAPGVQIGVLETARGGILLKGLGVTHNDVSLVTNVSADHLGLQGIDTVDQLAEVKAVVTTITRPSGWTVLNGDDPRVWAMRAGARSRPWAFTADPHSPSVRQALDRGGRATTVLDGQITVLHADGSQDRLIRLVDVPMTLGGLSRHNVANALAGASGALALGLDRAAVVTGLRTFVPDERLNPGRMNVYTVPLTQGGAATVIVDLAHNEAGLEALLDVARGLVAPGARLRLALGTAGDRTDEILLALGEIAGRRADRVVLAHKEHYLRGRTMAEMDLLYHEGLLATGQGAAPSYPTELSGLQALVAEAGEGDVLALMCHAERPSVTAWLADQGATEDSPATVREKVLRARGEHAEEAAITALWENPDAAARIEQARALLAEHPEDPRLLYELGGTFDSAGAADEALEPYRRALALGLTEPYRHRCQVQLASTLRNLGQLAEARANIEQAAQAAPESLGIQAFRALVFHDAGEPTEALRGLIAAVAASSSDPDVERYRRSLTAYAASLGELT